jgi:Flp pilus assembly protein TadD
VDERQRRLRVQHRGALPEYPCRLDIVLLLAKVTADRVRDGWSEGNLPSAQRLVEQAAAVDQTYAPAHNLRGAIHASAGDIPRARDAFRAALELDPRDTSIYTNLGRLEADGGDEVTAARLFAEALTLDPHLEPAREGLAEIRRRRQR